MVKKLSARKYTPSDYSNDDKLYRGYRFDDVNDTADTIELNAISFPDFSCNWSRFSQPEDIKEREGGLRTDGCFSFTVETARYKEMATPCHDPLHENYSHTEVRQLKKDEKITHEPPKGRKLKNNNWSKANRMEYRQHIINSMTIEFKPTA
ncbi:hypothetical protein MCHI_001314 [Candidatus Magnetoovum chiemensis]|nr:hypothetical protein MCHI_001314 [Candidatus Magnetoovum chiemensis]